MGKTGCFCCFVQMSDSGGVKDKLAGFRNYLGT